MNRKYNFNETIFEEINSPEKAYWLGFITADGGIENNGCHRLTIGLHMKDEEHLKKFRKFIAAQNPIKITNGKSPRAIIRISGYKIIQDLKKYNVIPNKSRKLIFPEITEQYYPDFIRGYLDGDGCLSEKGKNNFRLQIYSGTKSFLEEIQHILIKNCKLNKTKISHVGGNQCTCYCLRYGGNKQMKKIFDYLLQNSSIKLERKYKALKDCFINQCVEFSKQLNQNEEILKKLNGDIR